jgi:hypothetical protein
MVGEGDHAPARRRWDSAQQGQALACLLRRQGAEGHPRLRRRLGTNQQPLRSGAGSWHGAQQRRGRGLRGIRRRRRRGRSREGCCGCRPWRWTGTRAACRDPEGLSGEGDLDRAVRVGSVGFPRDRSEPLDRRRRGMAVGIAGAGRNDGDLGACRLEERLRRGRLRAVMRDLQHVDARDAAGQQLGIDAFLHISHEQESLRPDLAEEHDRDVVDRCPAIGWVLRHAAGIGPQHLKVDGVENQPISGREPPVRCPERGEVLGPGFVAGTWADHARLIDAPDPVPLQQEREAGDVILVRVAEDKDVDATVPGRQSLVQRDQEARRIRTAIDQQPAATTAFHEDPVALPDVQDDHACEAVGTMHEDERQSDRGRRQTKRREAGRAGVRLWRRLRALGLRRGNRRAIARRSASRGSFRRLCAGRHRSLSQVPDRDERAVAPARRGHDQEERHSRRHRVPRRHQVEARQRQSCAEPDDGDNGGVDAPRGQADERRDTRRQPDADEHPDDHREGASCHRRGDHGDDQQVHRRRDQRQPPEHRQNHRHRGRLGGKRNPQDVGDPSPRPGRRRAREPRRQARPPRNDPARREDGQAESGVVRPRRVEQQERGDRPAESGGGGSRPSDLPRKQGDARHDRGTHDRWRWADEGHVDHDRERGQDRAPAAPKPARQRPQRGRDDGDVPARDGDDVAGAGDREGVRKVAVDAIPQPDQDARRQAGLRLGHRSIETGGGCAPEGLKRSIDGARPGQDVERVRAQGPDRANLGQVAAVLVGRGWTDAARDLHQVAWNHSRVPRKGGRHENRTRSTDLQLQRPRPRAGAG